MFTFESSFDTYPSLIGRAFVNEGLPLCNLHSQIGPFVLPKTALRSRTATAGGAVRRHERHTEFLRVAPPGPVRVE
jgi:hypothetical protein